MSWSLYKYRLRKIHRKLIRTACSRLYFDRDRNLDKSLLVAGTARSGTSWLADIVASQVRSRLLFEPFHAELVPEYGKFLRFQYMPAGQPNEELYTFAHKVFSGSIRNRWIDRQNEQLFPRFRVIKDVRANLLLKWLQSNFPAVPILYIIRHPCAVVLSRMELGWDTDEDIEPFMTQTRLVAEHFPDKVSLIRSVKTDEEKHAIIWCISNLVPLRQFQAGELNVIFYENLVNCPETILPGIWSAAGMTNRKPSTNALAKPSTTSTRQSAVVTGENITARWTRSLSPRQIENVQRIVREFHLDHLYEDSIMPTGVVWL